MREFAVGFTELLKEKVPKPNVGGANVSVEHESLYVVIHVELPPVTGRFHGWDCRQAVLATMALRMVNSQCGFRKIHQVDRLRRFGCTGEAETLASDVAEHLQLFLTKTRLVPYLFCVVCNVKNEG